MDMTFELIATALMGSTPTVPGTSAAHDGVTLQPTLKNMGG